MCAYYPVEYIYIYIEEISTYVSMCKVYVIYIYDWPQAAAPFLSLQTRLCEVGVGAPQLQDDYVTCVRLPPRRPPKDKQQDEKSARYVIQGPGWGGAQIAAAPKQIMENHDWPQAAAPFLSLQTRLCEVGVGAPQLQDDYVTCVRLPPRRPPKDKQQDEKSARYVIHSSQTPTVEAKLLLEQSNHRVNCCWRSKCA